MGKPYSLGHGRGYVRLLLRLVVLVEDRPLGVDDTPGCHDECLCPVFVCEYAPWMKPDVALSTVPMVLVDAILVDDKLAELSGNLALFPICGSLMFLLV